MTFSVNFTRDCIFIERQSYPLDDFKSFLIKRYPILVQQCFIRAIHKPGIQRTSTIVRCGQFVRIETDIYHNGRTVFTYDWKEIFRRAATSVLPLHDFVLLKHGGSALP